MPRLCLIAPNIPFRALNNLANAKSVHSNMDAFIYIHKLHHVKVSLTEYLFNENEHVLKNRSIFSSNS